MDLTQPKSPTSQVFAICCNNIPESLFENDAAIDHFGRFGTITKIVLQPKKKSCIIEYELRRSADEAVLNAGAYDGFMFDVKLIKKRRPKVDNDSEWLPDPDVAAELVAMQGNQNRIPRLLRQQKMDIETPIVTPPKKLPIRKSVIGKPIEKKRTKSISKSPSATKSFLKSINKDEIRTLLSKPWVTVDDKLKALDIRDRLIRGCLETRHGALKGCCPDMCPEKERLLRQSQRQIASYEMNSSEASSNTFDPKLAIKAYSRSSADQEEPLPHELRPVPVLQQTLLYLLNYIVDLSEDPEESLSDWFHFMWDRLRAIRKDITQQALCCEGSIALVEACARFHAHCAARLVEEPSSSFDQRLNTENLLKCLQSLKYMYSDLRNRGEANVCINESEFRAYVILLNLHDANFMWEVQRLDETVRNSPEVSFAIDVFTAIDNNNYVKFFKLVKSTTYLNACILLRYFNNVRLQALKIMIKAYSPRGVSYFSANELMDILAFESFNTMAYYLEHYGVQVVYNEQNIPMVALDKSSFFNNTEIYPPERAIKIVEEKRKCSLGTMIYGKTLVKNDFENYQLHTSFDKNNYFKKSAILAEDQDNSPPLEAVSFIKKLIDSPIKMTSVESKQPQIPSNITSNGAKNLVFNFTEPKNVSTPQEFKTTANTTIIGDSIFKSGFQNNPPSSAFPTPNQNIFKSPTTNFTFSQPVASHNFNFSELTTSNIKTPNLFSKPSNSADVHVSQSGFVTKNNSTNIFSSNINTFPKITESHNTNNIFSNQNKSDQNIFLENKASVKPNILGGKLENKINPFADFVTENKLKEENEKRELMLQKIAEEKRLQEIARQKELKEKEELERRKLEETEKERKRIAEQKELERKEAEKKEFQNFVEKHSNEVVMEVIKELSEEICKTSIQSELKRLCDINTASTDILDDMCHEIISEECNKDINKEMRLCEIRCNLIARNTIKLWRIAVNKAKRQRSLLINTPTWLCNPNPLPSMRNQQDALQRMRDFHNGNVKIFKMPEDLVITEINVFDTVRKFLLWRCNELDRKLNALSLSIFWKIAIVLPNERDCASHSTFLQTWTKGALTHPDQKGRENHIFDVTENYWHKKFFLSISKVLGPMKTDDKSSNFKAMKGANGLLLYDHINHQNINHFKERLENILFAKPKLNCLPIALILITEHKELTVNIEKQLENLKSNKVISEIKIYVINDPTDNLLTIHTKKALRWLALKSPMKPPIETNKLSTFLDQCIGSELWYRFKLALNSSIKHAFDDVEIIINLYNEAVNRTIDLITDDDLTKYPSFADELKQYTSKTLPYPKDYEYISNDWLTMKINNKDIISLLKVPRYCDQWPPISWTSFQTSIGNYIKKLNWFADTKSVFLKVLAIYMDVNNDVNSEPDCKQFLWIDIMQVLLREKIEELKKRDKCVVYKKDDLENFRSTPWWYKSVYVKNVYPHVEEIEIDFLDDTLDNLGINTSKKRKLNASLESIDDDWFSSTLETLNKSLEENSSYSKILSDLENSIHIQNKKQAEIEALLKSALNTT